MALASENVSLTTVSYKINHSIDFTLGRRGATPFTWKIVQNNIITQNVMQQHKASLNTRMTKMQMQPWGSQVQTSKVFLRKLLLSLHFYKPAMLYLFGTGKWVYHNLVEYLRHLQPCCLLQRSNNSLDLQIVMKAVNSLLPAYTTHLVPTKRNCSIEHIEAINPYSTSS